MKQYILFFSMAALLSLTACDDGNSFSDDFKPALSGHYLKLQSTNINLDASGGAKTNNVTSVGTSWQFSGMSEWLTVSPSSGNSDATVSISATENKSGDDIKTCLLNFGSTDPDYSYKTSCSVTQTYATPYINVSPEPPLTFDAKPGSKTISVSSNIEWTLSGSDTWLTVKVNNDKSSITFSVLENTTQQNRTATITLKGITQQSVSKQITVTQYAPGVPTTNQASLTFENTGGRYSLSLTSEVSWTATTSESWFQVTPESGSAGTSTLQIEALPNSSANPRQGYVYIHIGDTKVLSIFVSQKGIYIETEPLSLTFTATASQHNLQVKSNTQWKVLSKPDWLTITPQQGNGNANLTLSAPDYWDTTSRSGILKLGQEGTNLTTSVTITQQGRTFDNLIATLQFESTASFKTVDITTNGKWTAKTDFEWISVEPQSGTGNGTLKVSVTENVSDGTRIGTVDVTVGSIKQTISVEQKGKYFTIDPTAFAELPSKGGTHSLHISTTESWTATSSSDWIALSQKSGTGDIDVTLTAPDNPSIKARNDTTTFSPTHLQPIKVITRQAARYLRVDAPSINLIYKAGTSNVVTITTDATYTIKASNTWMTIHQTDNTFTVEVTENHTDENREGKIIITMTGLRQGESYVLEIPVNQRGFKSGVDVDPYDENQQWDLTTGEGFSITVTGFSSEKSWDGTANTGLTITVTTYDEDKQWD